MINTYTSALYLLDEVGELINLKYGENPEIIKILSEFQQDLQIIHDFTRKLVAFENEKLDNSGLQEAYNAYRSKKSINLMGEIV